ncbi:MAG TPA: DNA repair protein RadC [Phototrophicaceae bacterium]|nr:DNA repair protein RadC [Phototrophicaceae bacterium]
MINRNRTPLRYQYPYVRLISEGADALSNAELLAIILRVGDTHETALDLSQRLLAHYHGLYHLAQANVAELQESTGLSRIASAEIVAAFELGKRLIAAQVGERPAIHSAADAARYLADMAYLAQEHVRVILLDSARRVIAAPTIYIGTINISVLRVAEIFREAITRGSASIILVHNHPSGDPTPSPQDIELTRALANAGRLLDIALVDHLIIGAQGYSSLRELGFLM